ncbi:MAK10-like protein [Tanacetum coccineum]
MGYRECLAALIVCIENGLIVRKHGTGNLREVIKKYPTIMLEAIASYDLWIWHAFFGVAGANNDLTVLNHSPLFNDLLDDIAPVVSYEVNGVTFEKGDENLIRTLGDYSKPSHEGYMNTIELPVGNNVVLLRSDAIRTIDQSVGGKLHDRNAKESGALLEDLSLYDNESWNDTRDIAKPVKAICLPQDVPSTSERRLIKHENQIQCLMEAHLAAKKPVQVNKISSSCKICSGPHDTRYFFENLEQAFVNYASSRTNEAGGLVSNFMASQDARLSKFEAGFKQQQSEMTNKIDTVLKAITDRITRALPSDTIKNLKLNVNSTSQVLSAHSYPTEDPQC